MSTVDKETTRLSWRYNKFMEACKPPAPWELREWRENRSRHQVKLGENVGDDILLPSCDGLIQFSDELLGRNSLILLRESNGQTQVELAPGNRLRSEVRDAGGRVGTILFR